MKLGCMSNMDEVAVEAWVARPTAYRYFNTIDSLLNEVKLDEAVEVSTEAMSQNLSTNPEERLLQAEAAMHRSCYENETQLRVMLANSLNRDPQNADIPAHQNGRQHLIESEARDVINMDHPSPAAHCVGGCEEQIMTAQVCSLSFSTHHNPHLS